MFVKTNLNIRVWTCAKTFTLSLDKKSCDFFFHFSFMVHVLICKHVLWLEKEQLGKCRKKCVLTSTWFCFSAHVKAIKNSDGHFMSFPDHLRRIRLLDVDSIASHTHQQILMETRKGLRVLTSMFKMYLRLLFV